MQLHVKSQGRGGHDERVRLPRISPLVTSILPTFNGHFRLLCSVCIPICLWNAYLSDVHVGVCIPRACINHFQCFRPAAQSARACCKTIRSFAVRSLPNICCRSACSACSMMTSRSRTRNGSHTTPSPPACPMGATSMLHIRYVQSPIVACIRHCAH